MRLRDEVPPRVVLLPSDPLLARRRVVERRFRLRPLARFPSDRIAVRPVRPVAVIVPRARRSGHGLDGRRRSADDGRRRLGVGVLVADVLRGDA